MNTYPRPGRVLIGALLLVLLCASNALPQTPLREQATQAYEAAQNAESALKERPAADRSRAEYLRLIQLYERVYLITPHSGYADNALVNIASLYEEIGNFDDAITTLQFLIREYPSTRFVSMARTDIDRLGKTEEEEAASIPAIPAQVQAQTTSPPKVSGVVSVVNIRSWESQRSVRVVVDMDGEPTFVQGEAYNPPRVFIDIANSRVGERLVDREFPVDSVMLRGIRLGQFERDTVRVVLDLVELSDVTTFALRDPNRLVIDILGNPPAETDISSSTESELTPLIADIVPEAVPDRSEAEDSRVLNPARPTENGDHSLVRSLGLKIQRVVIDPGHGGRDTGTIGPNGLTEKELVLDIAHRLKTQIELELGAEVVLTRNDDSFVPLETRTAIANQSEADLFLSIHVNSSRIDSIRGFETYFLNFATSPEASEIAARENASSAQSISELQNLVSKILLRDKVDESREFASHVQRALASAPNTGRNRGVKQAPFVVLIGANMPSILSEVSFISNPDDEQMLRREERREQIAQALFNGVRSYSDTLSGFETAHAQD